MVNARNVIVDAYRMTGIISDGEALDGVKTVTGEQLLNSTISGLNLEGFFASSMVQCEYLVTAPQRSYTIGTQDDITWAVPDIVSQRPAALRRVYFAYNNTGVPIEIPIVGAQDIYGFSTAIGAVGIPTYCAYLSNYPYGEIQFNVKPMAGIKLFMVYDKALPTVAINDVIPVPPEYDAALKYALAYVVAVRNGRPPEVQSSMLGLRDEAFAQIRGNMITKTGFMASLQMNSSVTNPLSIYTLGAYPAGF